MKIACWRIVFFAILIFQPENGAARPQGPVPPPPPVPNRAATDMWRGLAKRARKLIEEGGALEQQGRIFEALALYQKAYALYPNHTVTNSAVGWTYHRLGRDREALPYLERALAQNLVGELHESIYNILHPRRTRACSAGCRARCCSVS